MVACFRRGQAAHVLFQHPNDNPNQNPKPVHMACDEEKMADYEEEKMMEEEKDGEQMQDGLMDVAAIVAAIEDGTISVADMDAIVAAVMARKAAAEVTEEVEVEEEAAPAAAPGESMSRGKASVEMARALGEVAALRARLEQREQADQRREAVSVAMKRLDGRPLGSDLEKKLVAFHAKHGAKAFAAHVDAMVETFASYSEDPRAAFFAGQTQAVPEVANRYLKDGVEAVDRAARFAREHAELVRGGHTRMSLDRYVELNMTRN